MLDLTYFTVIADYKGVIADTVADTDSNPENVAVTATVTIKPVIKDGDAILAVDANPRPIGIIPGPIVAMIDTDGRLKLRPTPDGTLVNAANFAALPSEGETGKYYVLAEDSTHYRWDGEQYVEILPYQPVRLLANTEVLGLASPLYYSVSFSHVMYGGKAAKLSGFTFEAPNTDTELNLISVARQPGQPAVGGNRIAPSDVRFENGLMIWSFGGVDIPEPLDLNVIKGEQGEQGEIGATGAAATISVGTVTSGTVPAVTNAGTSSAAVLNFVLAKGDPGSSTPLEIINVKEPAYGAAGNDVADDTTGLNAAISAAGAAGGGLVYLPKGIYRISSPLMMTQPNVTLMGAGRGATIIKTVGNHQLIAAQASALTIRDLQLLGDADATKTLQRGIEGANLTGSLIHNVLVKNMGYDGLCLLNGCSDNTIGGCLVEGCQDDGINIGGGSITESRSNTVVGNTVRNCAHTGIHISNASSFTTVTGNTIHDCGSSGIDTFQTGAYVGNGNHVISSNTIRDCTVYGVWVADSNDNVVAGNSISGCGTSLRGENTDRTQFMNNNVRNATAYGFVGESDSSDLLLIGNAFSGAKTSVLVNSPLTQVSGNRVTGVSTTSMSFGATADDCVISNNVVSGGTGYNIATSGDRTVIAGNRLSGGSSSIRVVSAECVVSHNIITGSSTGVEVNAATDCLVQANTLNGQTTNGISMSSSATRAQVVANHISGAKRAINLATVTDCYVANNVTVASVTEALVENTASSGNVFLYNRFDAATVTTNGSNGVFREPLADIGNVAWRTSANFHRSVWRRSTQAFTAVSGATLTATGLIPKGAVLFGVTTRITTSLGTSNGTTGYSVGDGSDADLWGAVTSVVGNSSSDSLNFTATGAAGTFYTSAQDVVITATGGNFNGTGAIEVVAHYMICEAT